MSHIPRYSPYNAGRFKLSETVMFRPETEKLLDERLRVNNKDPDALFTFAALRTLQGRFDEALDWIQSLEEVEPRYPGLWRLKAKIYELMGNHEKAAIYWKMGCDGSR